VNKSIALPLLMAFSLLFGDNIVHVRHGDQQKAQGEFIGTYMNHVHILVGGEIIYYACDDIVSITYASEGFSYGKGYDYDCSKNTVTADILFPPELDPMTGEMAQILPDVFNPNIPKPAVEKATPVVQKPDTKIVAVDPVDAPENFVIIDGVKYARVTPEKETAQADYGHYLTNTGSRGTTLSTLEIRSRALMNARQKHVGPGWGLLGLAGCGTGMVGGMIGGAMADFPGFLIGGALGLSLPSLFASGSASSISVPYYPAEIKTQNEQQLYKDAYVKETGLLRRRSTVTGTGVGLLGFGAFMLVLISSF
jgi:hypothetical protein